MKNVHGTPGAWLLAAFLLISCFSLTTKAQNQPAAAQQPVPGGLRLEGRVLDSSQAVIPGAALRARQLTEQLLQGVRYNRAKVVVMDITGVPTIDSKVANHLVQTVEATRLLAVSLEGSVG